MPAGKNPIPERKKPSTAAQGRDYHRSVNMPRTHAKSKGSTPKRRTVNPKNLPSTKGRKRNSAK